MSRAIINTDIVIIGGGIAGLWLLNRVRSAGYSALLLESGTLGCGQTIASQGIIHSGAKYTLTGKLTPSAQAIANMPTIWRNCLNGNGEIDLRSARVLSEHQYLWSTGHLASRLTAFFASKALRSRVTALSPSEYPTVFQQPAFRGRVYQLEEMVLDIPSVIQALSQSYPESLLQIAPNGCQPVYSATGEILYCDIMSLQNDVMRIQAERYIFTAGAGNAEFLAMQRRPLHMVMVKHTIPISVYAHCMEANPKPRITITTHTASDGTTIWYLGGQLAESGVNKTPSEQCQAAKTELETLFPWLDFSNAQWSTLRIDRAEPAQTKGQLPDGVFAQAIHNAIIAWPTKLALAPELATEIMKLLPTSCHPQNHTGWSLPPVAIPAWDEPREWVS
jgi:glycerol-3-phosphate dehydrogenase